MKTLHPMNRKLKTDRMATQKVTVTDILYFGTSFGNSDQGGAMLEHSFIDEFKGKFPDAIIEDAHDRTMGYSQFIRIHNIYLNDYYAWMVARGWHKTSLNMNERSFASPGFNARVTSLAKKRYPHLFD